MESLFASPEFKRRYIYDPTAIVDMMADAKSLTSHETKKFQDTRNYDEPLITALIEKQNDKYNHSGCSAYSTVHFAQQIMTRGPRAVQFLLERKKK